MKKLNYWAAYMVVLMMVFASCSKEDTISPDDTTPEMVELRFDSVLTDLTKAVNTKSHETPNCDAVDEGLDPTHVLVYLSEDQAGLNPVAGSPFELNLINVGGTWKTNQSIQLEPGTYYLQDFIVYADDDVMWAAPHTGSDFENYVSSGQSLPRALQVFSGTKPYERQEVLCYSEEQRDFYGFEFFIVDDIELENYCIFVNVCDEGMEYPAQFRVQAFKTFLGTRTQDPPLNIPASGSENQTFTINGAAGATVLCVPLPALEDQDVNGYELEVTLVEPDGNGYTGNDSPGYSPNYWPYNGAQPVATIIVNSNNLPSLPGAEGVNHLFIDCEPGGEDCPKTDIDKDGDCFPDNEDCQDGGEIPCDNCPDDYNPNQEDSDVDQHGNAKPDGVGDECDNCPSIYNPDQGDHDKDGFGDVCDLCPEVYSIENKPCDEIPGNSCETAYMLGDPEVRLNELGLYPGNNWGWGAELKLTQDVEVSMPLYAGAGQNDWVNNGFQAGNVILLWDGTDVAVTIALLPNVSIKESHIFFGDDGSWPAKRSPGKLGHTYGINNVGPHSFESSDGEFNIIVHAKVCSGSDE